ncbi:MAG TPA: hypothetical protein EYQ23_04715, partial [Verrucomicrobiales bacterium]|nr:hypothetical protein [Verrucomicrobiales bacterium]
MKHVWKHPEDSLAGKRMFRSLSELEQSPAFVNRLEREFPQGAAELSREGDEDSLSRRSFMRFMGASTALAGIGLASCRRPVGKILPYADSVEWMVPGKAVYYATAMPRLGGATPIIAKVHEGRPIHLQGNALHPGSLGSTDQFAIASILDFYDPERSRSYRKGRGDSKTIEADEFWSFVSEKKKEWAGSKGNGLAFLHGASTSPTRARVADLIYQQLPEVSFYEYEAVDNKSLKNATISLFGKENHVRYQIDKAHRILSIGSDFMGVDRVSDSAASDFSMGRKVDHIEGEEKPGPMNRLYVAEHQYTVTGGMADHRLPVKVSEQSALVNEVAKQVAELTGDARLKSLTRERQVSDAIKTWTEGVVKDLYENKGKSLVLAGNRQDEEVHALCLAINN